MSFRALDGSANAFQVSTKLKLRTTLGDDSFAVGIWIRPTAYEPTGSVFPRPFQWRNSAGSSTNLQIITGSNASPSVYWDRRQGANIASAEIKSGAADGKWAFSICRVISTTNMRSTNMTADGAFSGVASAVDTSSVDTTTTDELRFGWDVASVAICDIAECWVAAPDPFAGMTDIPNYLLRHIAYNGPFSYASIAKNLQFYAPLRSGWAFTGEEKQPYVTKYLNGTQNLRVASQPPISSSYQSNQNLLRAKFTPTNFSFLEPRGIERVIPVIHHY
jgi:hypothetical protein